MKFCPISGFAFGLLVYSILQISYQIEFISANGNSLYQCASYVTLALDILFPIYSTFTLFFTVKYMNVVINVHQDLARFCLMHAIGTSLTFWVFTIIRETTDAIAKFDVKQYGMGALIGRKIDEFYTELIRSTSIFRPNT